MISIRSRILSCLLTVTFLLCGLPCRTVLALESELMPLAERSLLLDGQIVDGRIIVVGERGHVLISADQGRTWEQQGAPTRATLTSLFFVDDQYGWAAGHDAVILKTEDGGRHWREIYNDPEEERPILDLWFRDQKHGYAVGAYGLFLATDDGGQSWTSFDFKPATLRFDKDLGADSWDTESTDDAWGIDFHLNQIAATHEGRLYIAAEAGHLFRSDDACRSWISLPSPYDGSFYGTLPLNNHDLLLFGLRGHLFRSQDAGVTWQEVPTGTQATLNDAQRLHDGRIIVVGLAGTVLISDDEGASFSLHAQTDRAGIARVLEAADGALILIGEHGARRLVLPTTGRETGR